MVKMNRCYLITLGMVMGGLLGPALVILAIQAMTPVTIFILSGSLFLESSRLVSLLYMQKGFYYPVWLMDR